MKYQISMAFGVVTMSQTVYEGHQRFEDGREDDPVSGCPNTSITDENIKQRDCA